MCDIIYCDDSDSQGLCVESSPNGLVVGYFADGGCIFGETTIPWDKIIKAIPIRDVEENKELFKNIVCAGCKEKRPIKPPEIPTFEQIEREGKYYREHPEELARDMGED